MLSVRHLIARLKAPLLEDGVISLGETSLLIRALRPFVQKGDGMACELRDLLVRVRMDGVITTDESRRIGWLMDQITDGGDRIDRYIFDIPDYPKPGMVFRDTTRLLDTPWLFGQVMEMLEDAVADIGFDIVAAPEPRGQAFGAAIAARSESGFVPVCGPGRLPRETISESFESAHGRVELQMHADAVMRGERVLIVDDLLATGQTAAAVARMVKKLGGQVVRMVFPVEIEGFRARERTLAGYDVITLVKYKGNECRAKAH